MDENEPKWKKYRKKFYGEVVIDQPMWRLIYKHVKPIRLKDFIPQPKKPKR